MPVVYMDVLFLVNLFVNTFLILGVAVIMRLKVNPILIGLGAGFGALYGCIVFLDTFGIGENFFVRMLCALGIVLISFGRCNIFSAVKRTLCFASITVVSGIGLLAFLYFTDMGIKLGGVIKNGVFYFDIPTLWLALCTAGEFCLIIVAKRISKNSIEPRLCLIKVSKLGKTVEFTALVDTGNMLRDPLTGKKVIIAEAEFLSPLFSFDLSEIDGAENLPEGFRLIPFSSIGTESGLLAAFVPDSIYVDRSLKKDFVTAVFCGRLSPRGDYHALIGPNL